ncbi:hypothetical protein B0H34DRAFT_841288 [Crassisporium funariophilum]|nr:hypothetical protein B0H34DRAFT_841288 [Crassisporium funariophilum]
MQNLLRTLTESHVRPAADLRLLLSTVKEGRGQSHDAKLSDPFYDSLEGLLSDLRTITIDNRDAEAFLKPVSRAEVPDYYDVIQNPMDLQTMLKKVKQKQYKSKRDFKDDLDLIWSNCFTYNAAENHPLRQCVKRLKVKAEKLLKYITDRKERTDPTIPSDLPSPTTGVARPRLNGVNGYANGRSSHTRSPSFPMVPKSSTSTPTSSFIKPSVPLPTKRILRDVPFSETPALIRSAEGMSTFLELEKQVNSPHSRSNLAFRLRELAPVVEYESDLEQSGGYSPDEMAMVIDNSIAGDKRKMNGFVDRRPRKRTRFTTQYPTPLLDEKDDLSQLWWGAAQSDILLSNGLPGIPFGPSTSSSSSTPSAKQPRSPTKLKRERSSKHQQQQPQPNPKSLLTLMNTNIKTLRRIRDVHAKFSALNVNTASPEDEEQGGEGGGIYGSGAGGSGGRPPASSIGTGYGSGFGIAEEEIGDKIDEEPWTAGRRRGKGKSKVSGLEMGEANAADCLRWAGTKILEHSNFQGSSKLAVDVLTSVTSQYLQNVGRTIRFLSDKFGKTMTPEEIILHTLFESGSPKMQDLERYISDDIERYGSRLGDVEKKLVGAYRETAAVLEDEGLFEEEDEEETGALAMGDFADILGEDYLGLRELGIAAEFGMSNLSIPKRLLRGKKGQNKPTAVKPNEPPPPYPPPPPFIPLTADKVDDQIGLLRPYYQNRFALLAASAAPSLPGPLLGPTLYPPPPPPSMLPPGQFPPHKVMSNTPPNPLPPPPPPPDLALLDDTPTPIQVKMGPIGQIVKGGTTSGGTKKKKSDGTSGGGGPGGTTMPRIVGMSGTGGGVAQKKKKTNTGVGSGNGRKKKLEGSVVGMGFGPGGQGGPTLPAVVVASV